MNAPLHIRPMDFADIVNEWNLQFPILSPFTKCTIFATAEIVLIGLRLEKDRWNNREYMVFLEIIPLWKTLEQDVDAPFVYERLRNEKGFQYEIPLKKHTETRHKSFEDAKRQFGNVLKEHILSRNLFKIINAFPSEISLRHNSFFMSRILELKFALAIYYDNQDLVTSIKKEIEKELNYWDKILFTRLFKKSTEEWKEGLYQRIGDRDVLMEQVARNMENKKVSRLKAAHLIYEPGCYEPPATPFRRRINSILEKLQFLSPK